MNEEFIEALNEIEEEKGISKEVIFDAIESALLTSYKKNFNTSQNVSNVKVEIDRETGNISVSHKKEVVEEVVDPNIEISLEDAREKDKSYEIGDIFQEEVAPKNFGRIAAQTARQVVIQRIKDAERDVIFDDFIDRENELITGEVQRVSRGNVFVDLGKTEAILPISEQIRGEKYTQGERYKMLLLEVSKTPKGPQITLSRSHPNLVKRLFELEVPEINDGIVEIYSIAREAGSRTKLAVFSRDEEVDALGACVGYKSSRVKAIVNELHNEKVDIVMWEKEIRKFIANALSPSKVIDVFVNHSNKSALVVVPDYQLSLAIGKEGQNARLAAKLTNWKIDIKSETQFEEYLEENNYTRETLQDIFDEKSKKASDEMEKQLENDSMTESELQEDSEEINDTIEVKHDILDEENDKEDISENVNEDNIDLEDDNFFGAQLNEFVDIDLENKPEKDDVEPGE